MECLQIDWKNVDHTFVRDEFYENIQAPKWIDFAARDSRTVDDREWFCDKTSCTHEKKTPLEPQPFIFASKVPKADVLAPLAEKQLSTATGRRVRSFISTSVPCFSSIKGGRPLLRSKAPHNTQTPFMTMEDKIGSHAGQASENENPNRSCRVQGMPKGYGIDMKHKLAQRKDSVQQPKPGRQVPARFFKDTKQADACAVVNVSKPGKRNGIYHEKGLTEKNDGREELLAAKKPEASSSGGHLFSNSSRQAIKSSLHLRASISVPVKKVHVAMSIQNACFNGEKSSLCRPPRVIPRKETEHAQTSLGPAQNTCCQEKLDSVEGHVEVDKLEAVKVKENHIASDQTVPPVQDVAGLQRHSTNEPKFGDEGLQEQCPSREEHCLLKQRPFEEELQLVEREYNVVKPETAKEDSIESTLEDFLRNLHLTAPEDEPTEDCRMPKQDGQSICNGEQGSSVEGSCAMDLSSEASNSAVVSVEEAGQDMASASKDCIRSKANQQAGGFQPLKCRLQQQSRKRKSSELNWCATKDHVHGSQKVPAIIKTSVYQKFPTKLHAPVANPLPRENLHKKARTMVGMTFKPFRLRTQERGDSKDLKKDADLPNQQEPQELVRHALKMPSFGHPFRPQRSTKKLTIPKEPNFHSSRTRKTCIQHAALLAS